MGHKPRLKPSEGPPITQKISDEDYKLIQEAFEEGHAVEAKKVETRGVRHFIRHLVPHWDQKGCWWVQCYCAVSFVANPKLLRKRIYE